MYAAAGCLRLVGQHFLFAGDHVEDGPRGQHDVERQCATKREDDSLTELFHEQFSFLFRLQSMQTVMYAAADCLRLS